EAASVRRVAEDEGEGRERLRLAELRRVAAEDACVAAAAERLDRAAHQAAGFGTLVDEEAEARGARQGLEPHRGGAGQEVKHACALYGIAIGVLEDVEDRLAQPVRGRTDFRRARSRDRPAAEASADDPHALGLASGRRFADRA